MEELRIIQRTVDRELEAKAVAAGMHPVAARVLAGRGVKDLGEISEFLAARLDSIPPPLLLKNMGKASRRLAMAVMGGEVIGLQTDYDVDGLGAHSVMKTVLTEVFGHPEEKIQSVVGNRLTEGYGMTDAVADRILALSPRPTVLITADTGSSDEPRIARLKQADIEVIVTDHHMLPVEGAPGSAFAVINPQQPDCEYPDKAIAGGMVAWLLMAQTRRELVECEYLTAEQSRGLVETLDYVACSTVADCVSLGSSIANRAVVQKGLKLINERRRPCWQAVESLLGEDGATAETISFGLAPRINSRTRLDEPMAALHFMMAKTLPDAAYWAEQLEKSNQARKEIERAITESATEKAEALVASGATGITLLLENAHPGVQGICASRIIERFGRPALLCSPNIEDDSLVTGSARGVPGFHCSEALNAIKARHPGLLLKAGGHAAAAGLQLRRDDFGRFQDAMEAVTREMLAGVELGPYLMTDGDLEEDLISTDTLKALSALEPFGRGFERALFTANLRVAHVKRIGDGSHLKLKIGLGRKLVDAVWFRALDPEDEVLPISQGETVRMAFELQENVFRGRRSLQMMIRARTSGSTMEGVVDPL